MAEKRDMRKVEAGAQASAAGPYLGQRWPLTGRYLLTSTLGPMLVLRFLGGLFLLLATISLVADGTRALAGPTAALFTPIIQYWADLAPKSLASVQTAVKTSLHPLLWDVVIRRLLAVPVWALFGVVGLLLAYAGRHRRRVNIFIN